jgi:hypothetical protein
LAAAAACSVFRLVSTSASCWRRATSTARVLRCELMASRAPLVRAAYRPIRRHAPFVSASPANMETGVEAILAAACPLRA